jgi:hypothetical protein
MLDTSEQQLVFIHAGGGTGKTYVTSKIFEKLLLGVKSAVALVQPVLVPVICHKDVHFTVCSRLGCQV